MSAITKPEIKFLKGRPPVTAESGSNLMQVLLGAGLPVASSCRGDGICAKCRVRIVEGAKNLSSETAGEIYLRDRHAVPVDERISCQVVLIGDITVDTDYW